MKNGAAYIRVSTDDQMEYSPDSQMKKIYEYAKAHDIILSDEFIFMEDEGKSGRSAKKRPQFQRIVCNAANKKAAPGATNTKGGRAVITIGQRDNSALL